MKDVTLKLYSPCMLLYPNLAKLSNDTKYIERVHDHEYNNYHQNVILISIILMHVYISSILIQKPLDVSFMHDN